MHIKAQSAIEYLSTYGWAILITTVVIALLFKVTVLNGAPSLNTCIATSGFSCSTPILATNGTLTTYFGEVGKTINVTGYTCTANATGANVPYSATNQIQLLPNYQTPLAFNCTRFLPANTMGTQFNGWLWVRYDIRNGPSNVVDRIAKVAAAISTVGVATGGPSSPPGCSSPICFKITNTNTIAATGASFQQRIAFNPSNPTYNSLESAGLGNIRFKSGSTVLNSWCESGCNSTSTRAVFWVLLTSGIAANSNIIVNATLLPVGTTYDGSTAGECPLCSPSYASRDNGASVFSFYDSFAYNAPITSPWTATSHFSSGGYINNGLVQKETDCLNCVTIYAPYSSTGNVTLEILVKPLNTPYALGWGLSDTAATQTQGYRGMIDQNGYADLMFMCRSYDGCSQNSGSYSTTAPSSYNIYGITWVKTLQGGYNTHASYDINYWDTANYTYAWGIDVTNYFQYFTSTSYVYFDSYSGSTWHIPWVRIRKSPPGEVMPSAVQQ